MSSIKYTGVTLTYLCRDKNELIAVKKSYITNARSITTLKRKVNQIRKQLTQDMKGKCCKYLGVNDVFEINGPLHQGAILGRVILWSYKTILAAKKILKSRTKFWIYTDKRKFTRQYIAEIVFMLGSPARYRDRRVIICNVLIEESNNIGIYKKAMKIGASRELREKLFSALLLHEPLLENKLTFLGIANIKFVYEEIGIGKCFEALFKKERSLSSAKKLAFPLEKCLYKF